MLKQLQHHTVPSNLRRRIF